MTNRITEHGGNHRMEAAAPVWRCNQNNFAVGAARAMLEFLIAPGTPRDRDDNRRIQSIREKFTAEFKADSQWVRHANLETRLRAAKSELTAARTDAEDAETQYTTAIAGGDETEIATERETMEKFQAAVFKLTAEIKALKPAVAASYKSAHDSFNAAWKMAEQDRHAVAKISVQAVLAKIDAAISPLLEELQRVQESPDMRGDGALLDPALKALGPAPSLDDEPEIIEPSPVLARQHQAAHPFSFAR